MANNFKDFQTNLKIWDQEIRNGQSRAVAKEIKKMARRTIPFQYRREIASLLRRIGHYDLALKIIHPRVYDARSELHPTAKPHDIADYALILLRIGAHNQALRMLWPIDATKVPLRTLYLAYCYFAIRDYQQALPYLKSYLQQNNIDDYQRVIGSINLLSAYNEVGDFNESLKLSETLIKETQVKGHTRLCANGLELRGQALSHLGKYKEAQKVLLQSLELLKNDSPRYRLTSEMHLAYVYAKIDQNIAPLINFRKKALEMKNYEGVRHTDYLSLEFEDNPDIFFKLYFGTPYQPFREKLILKYQQYNIDNHLQWTLGQKGKAFDLSQGTIEGKPGLKPGYKPLCLLQAILSDLYRPRPLSVIHETLSPGEPFIPLHTPNKIKQMVFRLNRELDIKQVPLKIHIKHSSLHAEKLAPLRFSFQNKEKTYDLQGEYYFKLLNHFGDQSFSRLQAQNLLNLSEAQCKRLLQHLRESQRLLFWRQGSSYIYQISEKIEFSA